MPRADLDGRRSEKKGQPTDSGAGRTLADEAADHARLMPSRAVLFFYFFYMDARDGYFKKEMSSSAISCKSKYYILPPLKKKIRKLWEEDLRYTFVM